MLDQYLIPADYLVKILKNRKYNHIIQDYYAQLKKEDDFDNFINIDSKVDSIEDCNRYWLLDVYKKRKVKNFVKTNFCHDKFCSTCKKAKQANRTYHFVPELEQYDDRLYHMVLTVPNVFSEDLKDTIKKMFKAFRYFIRYLSLRSKVRGINFDYGYQGALRSLEVTFNNKSGLFHPHLHCAVVWDQYPLKNQENINSFSSSYKNSKLIYFSDFEILIQKVWYLIYNSIKVTKSNIDELKLGYSCIIKKFELGDYAELFKYMIKETDDNNKVLTYDVFKVLVYALHKCRQIQGYGCFFGLKVDDENDLSDIDDPELIRRLLMLQEDPVRMAEKLRDLLNDNEYYLVTKKIKFKMLIDDVVKEKDKNA